MEYVTATCVSPMTRQKLERRRFDGNFSQLR
jgi:hypothetical protein